MFGLSGQAAPVQLQNLQTVCAQFDMDAISAALRWLVHDSKLSSDRDDA